MRVSTHHHIAPGKGRRFQAKVEAIKQAPAHAHDCGCRRWQLDLKEEGPEQAVFSDSPPTHGDLSADPQLGATLLLLCSPWFHASHLVGGLGRVDLRDEVEKGGSGRKRRVVSFGSS